MLFRIVELENGQFEVQSRTAGLAGFAIGNIFWGRHGNYIFSTLEETRAALVELRKLFSTKVIRVVE